MFPAAVTVQKQIYVPLNDISGVCILLINGFIAKLCPVILGALVILAISDIIGEFGSQVRLFNQALPYKHVIHQFAVSLLRQFFRQILLVITAYQSVNHDFKDVLEIFRQQIVFRLPVHRNLIFPVKESIAQIPYSESLVREILVLDLFQSSASKIPVNIRLLQLVTIDKRILDIDFKRETMCLSDVIQNGEIYDKQLFVKVHHFLPVDRLDVNRASVLNYCLR